MSSNVEPLGDLSPKHQPIRANPSRDEAVASRLESIRLLDRTFTYDTNAIFQYLSFIAQNQRNASENISSDQQSYTSANITDLYTFHRIFSRLGRSQAHPSGSQPGSQQDIPRGSL